MSNHPFERAGLGQAPFRCVEVRENWFVSGCGTVRKPGGHCHYCATGILYEYVIESADGRSFVVGSDCVRRTGAQVEGFREQRLQLARDKREAKRRVAFAERQARLEREREERREAFASANAELVAWLEATPDNGGYFLVDMRDRLRRWGSLTERQTLAVLSAMQREAQEARDRELSQFVGEIGKRVEGTFEIVATRSWESSYGWPRRIVYWTLMRLGADLCTYKGNYLGQRGERLRAKFTVKEHEVCRGRRQTKLARPKVLEDLPEPVDEHEPREEPRDHAYNNADRADQHGHRDVA